MDDVPVEQHAHWDAVYERKPEMFGKSPSASAVHAAKRFRQAGATRVLELGAGHGRDTLFFASEGFRVTALDYSVTGLHALEATAAQAGLDDLIETREHDVRAPLPLPDGSVDAVYAHLLLCMALSTEEIARLVEEVGRVLVPGGAFVYTVRNTSDAHYGVGIDHGDSIFETQGYAVHFFDPALVDALAVGWNLEDVEPDEEGPLPRRIWRVTQTTPAM
ncbi:MAG: class I SAM-dependent methyltransferase [Pseudolysinimonas sp.]